MITLRTAKHWLVAASLTVAALAPWTTPAVIAAPAVVTTADWTILPSPGGQVWALTSLNGAIYAGVWINDASTAAVVKKWDGTTWTQVGGTFGNTPGEFGYILALAGSGNTLYAAGRFNHVAGVQINNVAQIDTTAAVPAWAPLGGAAGAGNGLENYVDAMVVDGTIGSGGKLYLGGRFWGPGVGGTGMWGVAQWDGSSFAPLGGGLNANNHGLEVMTLALRGSLATGGTLFAGGNFCADACRVAQWNGSSWSDVGVRDATPTYVQSLSTTDTTLYAGGFFSGIGGISAHGVAQFTGGGWATVGTAPNDGVSGPYTSVVVPSGDSLYLAYGDSPNITVGGSATARTAAWWNGSQWAGMGFTDLPINQPGAALSMIVSNGALYVGGGNGAATGFVAVTTAVDAGSSPLVCTPGSYLASPADAACTAAPAGYFVSDAGATAATACAAGSYQPGTGQTSCLLAPAGSFVPTVASVSASLCAAGYYSSVAGAAACTAAPAGSFVAMAGAVSASLCAPGTFSSTPASVACTPAPIGFYVSGAGATAATACASGTTTTAPGAVACTPVPPANLPPVCSLARPSQSSVWPPNHRLVPISVLNVTDPEGRPVTIRITSIFQDEPTNDEGDGDTDIDGYGVGTSTAQIRAERVDGRVYHIGFSASDGSLSCTGEVLVSVPKDQAHAAVDGGALYDSTKKSAGHQHKDGDNCDHERGRNGHRKGDGCDHEKDDRDRREVRERRDN